MACPAITTGDRFLYGILSHIDCQARTIGSYGYGALADPGSSVSITLTSLLAIFIALFGIRLLLGSPLHARDVIGGVIRVGLVLTLAMSWPAWRVVGYDLILNGPAEISRMIGGRAGLPGARNDMMARLQQADDGIVVATMHGSGRLTGGVAGGTDIGDSVRGIALADGSALGMGRSAFLIGAIAPFAVIQIGAGILLALAPLVAGLALFAGTMGLFWGWARGLAFCALAAIGQALLQGVQLAMLEPFLSDVIEKRGAGTLTPSAPTELFVLALAFAFAAVGLLYLAARVAFFPWVAIPFRSSDGPSRSGPAVDPSPVRTAIPFQANDLHAPSRAVLVANAVSVTMRREEQAGEPGSSRTSDHGQRMTAAQSPALASRTVMSNDALGSRFRRSGPRRTPASHRRDQTS